MENWQICEAECLEYLKQNFSNSNFQFEAEGGSNSTKSDILLKKNGIAIFYIESKMKQAQCGQFVAFPNEIAHMFDYSKANAYPENPSTTIILEKMAEDFNRYKNPGTDGIELVMEKDYFYTWIYDFYKRKGVKYFIVEKEVGLNNLSKDNFVIFPIEHLHQYFDVNAFYKRKKSGSTNPIENNYLEIQKAAKSEGFEISEFYTKDKYVFVKMNAKPLIYKIIGETHTYQFKPEDDKVFKVTRLSNTSNPNVIFSISLVKSQQERDFEKFNLEFK